MPKNISQKKLREILGNQNVRKRLAYEDPLWFCLIYLRHHFKDPFAPFHMEMLHLLECHEHSLIVVMAFRGSGKSAIMNTANVLWSILGKPQKKFAVVLSQTQGQAKDHFANIKDELKHNELLREDFGPFADREGEWKNMSLELEYHGSKISSISMEQSVRGMKYGAVRPDLIVCDDIENSAAAYDEGKREETYRRFASEILPLGNADTRVIVLGNLICRNSLLMGLRGDIEAGRVDGVFRAYPIIDDERRVLWPGRYPNIERVKTLKKQLSEAVWTREFLLKLLGLDGDGSGSLHMDWVEMINNSHKIKGPPLSYQAPLIPQMKEFRISVPFEEKMPIFLGSKSIDPMYLRYFGNVYLDGDGGARGAALAMWVQKIEEDNKRERGE